MGCMSFFQSLRQAHSNSKLFVCPKLNGTGWFTSTMDQHLWSPTPKVVFQTWRNFNTFTFPRIRVALNHWFLHSTCFFWMVLGYAIGPPWPRCAWQAEFLDPKLVLGKPCAPKPFGVADNARPGRAPGPQMAGFCIENLHSFKDLLVLCLSFYDFAWYFVWYFVSNPLATFFGYFFGVVIDLETLRRCKVQGLWIVLETQLTSRNVSCMLIDAHRHLPSLETQRFLQQGMDMVIF